MTTQTGDPVAALAFRALNDGKGPHDVVAELEVAPEIVRRYHAAWVELAGAQSIARATHDRIAQQLRRSPRRSTPKS